MTNFRETSLTLMRALALASVVAAGSCAAPSNDANGTFDDPRINHPITVTPTYQSLKLYYAPADSGLTNEDAVHLDAFIRDYLDHGNGKIIISAPVGLNAAPAVSFLGRRINDMGVSKDRIMVASHDTMNGDMRVELNYISYAAVTDPCGDWSRDLSYTASNKTPPNFGCAIQHNIAAMVADPRDLLGPRPMSPADGARRSAVLGNYEKGQPTGATQSAAQSGAISDIGK